jgi:ketosteroid isomerase-like protein
MRHTSSLSRGRALLLLLAFSTRAAVSPVELARVVVAILVLWSAAVLAMEPPATAEQAIRSAHAAWFDALLGENVDALDRLLADDVTLGFPGGNLMPRAEFLSYLKVGDLYYDTAEHEDTFVRVYGTTGVVTGRSNLAYRFKGKAGFERLRYTAVYARTDGQWRLVAWQSTIRGEQ